MKPPIKSGRCFETLKQRFQINGKNFLYLVIITSLAVGAANDPQAIWQMSVMSVGISFTLAVASLGGLLIQPYLQICELGVIYGESFIKKFIPWTAIDDITQQRPALGSHVVLNIARGQGMDRLFVLPHFDALTSDALLEKLKQYRARCLSDLSQPLDCVEADRLDAQADGKQLDRLEE